MKSSRSLVIIIVAIWSLGAQSDTKTTGLDNPNLAKVSKLLQAGSAPLAQSVQVVRLSDGATLFEKQADMLLSPASVSKVITSAAVLAKFSPAHTFKTRFLYSGKKEADVVKGDLIVVGDGDPFVISEKLWQLAADIKHLGIREFTGDIIIDNQLFDDESRDQSRSSSKKGSRNAYDAPVSAFGVNFNTFAVAVAPTGTGVAVNIDPYPIKGLTIENNVALVASGKDAKVDVRRIGHGSGNEKIVASGRVAAESGLAKIYRSIGDHVLTPGEYLRSFLAGAGIKVAGTVREGKAPTNATPLVVLESFPLRMMVQGLNTFSNNYIADVLTKRLGAAFPSAGAPDSPGKGTLANGVGAMSRFLRDDVGIKSDFVLRNGSGLSTENRLSARQITTLLTYMEKRMDAYPEFLASLPASGWDGTLRRRFAKDDTKESQGLVRAKTGTLTEPISVSSLAGYFRHPVHGMVAFAIIENGKEGERQPAIADLRDSQDAVLAALQKL